VNVLGVAFGGKTHRFRFRLKISFKIKMLQASFGFTFAPFSGTMQLFQEIGVTP